MYIDQKSMDDNSYSNSGVRSVNFTTLVTFSAPPAVTYWILNYYLDLIEFIHSLWYCNIHMPRYSSFWLFGPQGRGPRQL